MIRHYVIHSTIWFPFAGLFPLCNRIKPMSAQTPDWHQPVKILPLWFPLLSPQKILLIQTHASSLELLINCLSLDMLGDQSNATMIYARVILQLNFSTICPFLHESLQHFRGENYHNAFASLNFVPTKNKQTVHEYPFSQTIYIYFCMICIKISIGILGKRNLFNDSTSWRLTYQYITYFILRLPSTRVCITFWLHMPGHCIRVQLHNGFMWVYMQIMQHMHTHWQYQD